jgi:hypothetical protein
VQRSGFCFLPAAAYSALRWGKGKINLNSPLRTQSILKSQIAKQQIPNKSAYGGQVPKPKIQISNARTGGSHFEIGILIIGACLEFWI